MTNPSSSGKGLTALGKLMSVILVLGLVGLGGWIVWGQMKKSAPSNNGGSSAGGGSVSGATGGGTPANGRATAAVPGAFDTSDLAETQTSVPRLDPPQAYVPAAGAPIDIELSRYAGYAGLIAANGGLDPSDNSYFNTKYHFKVRIKLSEEESWSALNSGKMAASATTADVLAVYGRQFNVVVPAQISYSRGADGLVVRNDIHKVNDLKGKVVSAEQFTESDFFIRYLAKEAGINVKMLPDLTTTPDSDAINLVYCKDGDAAGHLFEKALNANSQAVAACMTWAPNTTEIPAASHGKSKLLVSNKNLLIIADILIVNRGWAEKNPDKVAALVDGLLMGNKAVTNDPAGNADVIAKAFSRPDDKWDHARAIEELKKVHLSNLPEQQAFFSAGITQGGSFASIYQSAILDYGDMIPNPVDSDHFVYADALKAAAASGTYAGDTASITPISAGPAAPSEQDPVLSKDIRFLFEPNSAKLDMTSADNMNNLNAIKKILDVSPGSHIVLVGHVDNSRIPELMRTGGQALVDRTALEAMQLSKDRASEVMRQVIAREKADPTRLEIVGKGWTQPVSTIDPEKNRRVEVQWFTLE